MFKFANSFIGLFVMANIALADISSDYQQAYNNYLNRDKVDQSETLKIVQSLITTAQGQELYKSLILGAQASWWKGSHTADISQKKILFYQGLEYAQTASALNDKASEAYLWSAYNLGEIGGLEGPQNTLFKFRVAAIFKLFNSAIKLRTINGLPGIKDDNYGAVRNMAQLEAALAMNQVPGMLAKALNHSKYAYDHDKTHPRNFIGYAKVLILNFKLTQDVVSIVTAKAVLNEVLVIPTEKFDKIIQAQVAEDKATAQAILNSLN